MTVVAGQQKSDLVLSVPIAAIIGGGGGADLNEWDLTYDGNGDLDYLTLVATGEVIDLIYSSGDLVQVVDNVTGVQVDLTYVSGDLTEVRKTTI